MTDATYAADKVCLICGGTDCLIPLYTKKLPDAQPVAYIHPDCLRTVLMLRK